MWTEEASQTRKPRKRYNAENQNEGGEEGGRKGGGREKKGCLSVAGKRGR
jgi:hypothetical protein